MNMFYISNARFEYNSPRQILARRIPHEKAIEMSVHQEFKSIKL